MSMGARGGGVMPGPRGGVGGGIMPGPRGVTEQPTTNPMRTFTAPDGSVYGWVNGDWQVISRPGGEGQRAPEEFAPPPAAPPGSQTYPEWDPSKESYRDWYTRVFGTDPWKAPYDFTTDPEGFKEKYGPGGGEAGGEGGPTTPPDYTAPTLEGLGPDSTLTPLSHEDWLKSLTPDEFWRWTSGQGAGARFRDIFQPALEAAPNYYLSNPSYQRFLEGRFQPLDAQYLMAGLMNPLMEALPTQGEEEVLGLGGPHFRDYLMGNPAVEGQGYWQQHLPTLYSGFGGEAPTDAGALMRYEVGQEELNRPGAALGLLTSAATAGLNPVFGGSVANVMRRRERAARATQPNQGGFDWFRSMRPAMGGIFSGV